MKIDRKELKRLAKQRMKEAPTHPMLVTLVYGLVFFGAAFMVNIAMLVSMVLAAGASVMGPVGTFESRFNATIAPAMLISLLLVYVVYALVAALLQHGYISYSLRVADGGESGCGDIFAGFPRIGRVIPMNLALAGFYILWCLAIMVPGMFLMRVIVTALVRSGGPVLASVAMVVLYVAVAVPLMLVTMRYLFCNHALADDPQIGPLNAIRRSRALMKGRSGEGFLLQLSFVGWALIPVGIYLVVAMVGAVLAMGAANPTAAGLTVLLGMLVGLLAMIPLMLWLYPYISTTISLYYRALSPRTPEEGDEGAPLPDPNTPWRPEGEQ